MQACALVWWVVRTMGGHRCQRPGWQGTGHNLENKGQHCFLREEARSSPSWLFSLQCKGTYSPRSPKEAEIAQNFTPVFSSVRIHLQDTSRNSLKSVTILSFSSKASGLQVILQGHSHCFWFTLSRFSCHLLCAVSYALFTQQSWLVSCFICTADLVFLGSKGISSPA